jgi:hypothetical protein
MGLQVTTLFLKQHGVAYSNKDFMAQLGNDFIVGEHRFVQKQ